MFNRKVNLELIIAQQDREYDCLQSKYSDLKKCYRRLEEKLLITQSLYDKKMKQIEKLKKKLKEMEGKNGQANTLR